MAREISTLSGAPLLRRLSSVPSIFRSFLLFTVGRGRCKAEGKGSPFADFGSLSSREISRSRNLIIPAREPNASDLGYRVRPAFLYPRDGVNSVAGFESSPFPDRGC